MGTEANSFMTDLNARLQTMQWLVERQLGWIGSADSKIAVVIAIDTAMMAALGTAYSSAKIVCAWANALSIAASILVIIAMGCAAVSLLPRTNGPKGSLLFFGTVAKSASADYVSAILNATPDQLLNDFALQVHRNAEIAAVKHLWVRRSVAWSFLSALPWVFSIGLLVRQ